MVVGPFSGRVSARRSENSGKDDVESTVGDIRQVEAGSLRSTSAGGRRYLVAITAGVNCGARPGCRRCSWAVFGVIKAERAKGWRGVDWDWGLQQLRSRRGIVDRTQKHYDRPLLAGDRLPRGT